MSKLTTAQGNLSGKTNKMVVSQESAGGSLHANYVDPDMGFLVTSTVQGPVIRFVTAAQLNDFIASTGPNGKWPV